VNNDWAFETGLKAMLLPSEVLVVHIILLEQLRTEFLLLLVLLVVGVSLFLSSVFSLILKVESDRLLEVQLNSAALVLTSQGIINLNVDLGAVESTISMVVSPGSTELVQCIFESFFSFVPLGIISETLLGSSRELELEGKTENSIDVIKEIKNSHNFVREGFNSAENVSIILLESSYTGQARQGT
jgi:hypothetical protein